MFIASEFIEGVTLKKAIQRRTIDGGMAIRIATQIASALNAAHSAGVIHRDLKPANVMVRPDGYIKVIDFGLAKITDDSRLSSLRHTGLSYPGSVVGTVDYMSPEQARGEEVDSRTDLWSLGVLLYEMLSNQRPFAGETDSHVIVAILDRPVPTLPNLASVPTGVGGVITRALVKDPARRYQSAAQMLSDLERMIPPQYDVGPFAICRSNLEFRAGMWLSAALLAFALFSVWWWGFDGRDAFLEPNWFQIGSVKQVTFNGRTLISAISPDGKYLAFVVGDQGGMQSLHVKQTDQPSEQVRIARRKINYLVLPSRRQPHHLRSRRRLEYPRWKAICCPSGWRHFRCAAARRHRWSGDFFAFGRPICLRTLRTAQWRDNGHKQHYPNRENRRQSAYDASFNHKSHFYVALGVGPQREAHRGEHSEQLCCLRSVGTQFDPSQGRANCEALFKLGQS